MIRVERCMSLASLLMLICRTLLRLGIVMHGYVCLQWMSVTFAHPLSSTTREPMKPGKKKP